MLEQNALKNLKQTSNILNSCNLNNKYIFISNELMIDDRLTKLMNRIFECNLFLKTFFSINGYHCYQLKNKTQNFYT